MAYKLWIRKITYPSYNRKKHQTRLYASYSYFIWL